MKSKNNKGFGCWKNGSKKIVEYSKIISILKKVEKYEDHKIIVGSDSIKFIDHFIFTNSICVLNNNNFYDRRYFYLRNKIKDNRFYDLPARLLKETEYSIDIALDIQNKLENANIEIHADINKNPKHNSGKYINMVTGYIKGCGFDFKIKPDSFVASSIADNYTRKS
tara:strand:+ start:182 stop:682 length:501 start_codon:yes stop_codon:yes gene_type:complete